MTQVRAKYNINGNLAFHDSTYRQRLYDAFGPTVIKFLEHFVGTPLAGADSPAGWTVTLVEAGAGESTVALDAGEVGGALVITTDANEDDGAQLQLKGEAFKMVSGKPCYFGARIKIDDATQSDFLVGLCITDTTLIAGMSDGIYFRKVDATTSVLAVLELNTTETTTAAYTCDTAYHIVEFYFNGTAVDFFVDGVMLTRGVQTNLCTDEELTPSIAVLAGEAAVKVLTVDWIRTIQFN